MIIKEEKYPIDYDNNWKEVISGGMTQDFLAFFMPKLHADIDFTYPIDFLEQELYDIIQPADRDKVVDKLLRVRLKTGEDRWIFVHIEFQTSAEADFSARMYHYYRLIRAKYDKDVTALVIYTGKSKPRLYDHYKEDNYGTGIFYFFNTYQVSKQKEAELLANPNPFALVVLANYYVLKTTANQRKRLTFKEQLFELAQNRGYSDEKTARLFFFINELMRLIPTFDLEFKNHLSQSFNITTDMIQYSQSTIDIVNMFSEKQFGTTISEVQAAAQAKIITVIVRCHKRGMSVDEIADLTNEDAKKIYDILVAEKLIVE